MNEDALSQRIGFMMVVPHKSKGGQAPQDLWKAHTTHLHDTDTEERNLQSPDVYLPECQETAPAGQPSRKMMLKATKKSQINE